MKKILTWAGIAAGCAAVIMPALTFAAYMRAGNNVLLTPADAPVGNAYVAGGSVDVAVPIGGDLLAAGGTVLVSGKVSQDIMAAGGTIIIEGASAQDVRVAGGNITIGGKFSGEVVAAGGQITILPETTIVNDSYFAGGTVAFAGNESGNLTISGGEVTIDGVVTGNLIVKNAKKVTLGAHAVIKKNFEYSAPVPVITESGAQVLGQTVFHQVAAQAANGTASQLFLGFLTGWLIVKFFIVLTAAYLLWYLRRNDSLGIIDASRSHFWRELLRGFSFLILVPIAVIIAFMTIIGAIPALVALLAYVIALVLASPFAVIFVASLLRKDRVGPAWYHILLGSLILSVVALIPIVGWIACFAVYLAALGGMVAVIKARFQ
jgi:cytoskeletal protein CcmA (bactofilin family)